MAATYTTNVGLAMPATGDQGWGTTASANMAALDALAAVGSLAVTTTEYPSATLDVQVSAGTFEASTGALEAVAAVASQAMTASATNYLYLTDSGTLTVNTTGFPPSVNHVRLAVVVAGATTITSITDARTPFASAGATGSTLYVGLTGGVMNDASAVAAIHTGTTHGTQLGGASNELLGFWGATPVARPSGSAQAAITDSTGGTAGTSLTAIGATNSADQSAAINANFATLAKLAGAIRTALTTSGLMNGS